MKNGKVNKKRLFAVILSAALLLIGGMAAEAAYISRNSVKRVVSTQGSGGTAFSSNYLLLTPRETDSYTIKNIYCPEGADVSEFEINICNYVQNDPSRINEKDITYTLKVTQLNNDGTPNTSSFSKLKAVNGDGTSYSFSDGVCTIGGQFLKGNEKSVNTYIITVPKSFAEGIMLRAEAEPSDSDSYSAANGNKLGRVFTFSEYSAASTSWSGSFYETTTENYDAFNYIIRGQGKGTVKLEWDPEQLEINRFFLENYGLQDKITVSGGKKVLTLDVDSSEGMNRYDIQFYKTPNGIYTDIDLLNSYVTAEFTETD